MGSFTVDTKQFTSQINLNIENCWATLREVCTTAMEFEKDESSTFLYMKEPGQLTYRLILMGEDDDNNDEDSDDNGL